MTRRDFLAATAALPTAAQYRDIGETRDVASVNPELVATARDIFRTAHVEALEYPSKLPPARSKPLAANAKG